MRLPATLAVLVITLLSLYYPGVSSIAGAESQAIYEGSASQPLLCYVNTGTLGGAKVSEAGTASQFIAETASFGSTIQIDTGNKTYQVTVPRGEYGSSMIVLGVADNLTYPSSGGRVSLVIDTGHEDSLTAIRIGTLSYFDGQVSGIVWFKVDLEWSDDGSKWHYSNVFYNVSLREETIESPFQVFFAKGRYVRLNVTMLWTPDSGNRATGNAYLLAFIDAVLSQCYPYTPQAVVRYRIYEYYTSVNITLNTTPTGIEDYWYRTYKVDFPVNTSLALDTVNITDAPLSIENYNLTLIIDENGNPLPYKVNGNISVVMPMISQNITLIYLKHGKHQGAEWLPPDGLIWVFDFGDAIEQTGDFQGWIGYGTYYQTDINPDITYHDLSLHTLLTQNVYVASGGWYKTNLVLPPGRYYAGANILVSYRYTSFFGGRMQLIFYFREYNGTYKSAYLLNGRYTYYDGTVEGNITADTWGNKVYFTVRSYYARQNSQTWIRWAYILGIPSTSYNITVVGKGLVQSRDTVSASGEYYAVLPWFESPMLEPLDASNQTGYLSVTAGGTESFNMSQETSLNVTLTNIEGVDPYYSPSILIAPPNSSINASVLVEAPIPASFIVPDPPLVNTSVLFLLVTPSGVFSLANTTTNSTGYTPLVSLATPPSPVNATLIVVPLAWPYVIPVYTVLYVDTVTVAFRDQVVYLAKNSNTTEPFNATYTSLGLPFTGNITFNTSSPYITVDSPATATAGQGNLTIYSGNWSGRYQVTAVNASVAGLTFPATGTLNVTVTGARIIITVSPEGPPWYVYSNLTWTVKAVYDDGSPAVGDGYIEVEKDHYQVSNNTWNGAEENVLLTEIGYDNYLRAVLTEPTGDTVSNYSLVVAIPPGGNTTGNGTYSGVELMSFTIETYQQAGLKDGLIAVFYIALALAPFYLRRYTGLFKGPAGRIIWMGILLGFTIVTMVGRAQIPVEAYIVQTNNGTTIEPVYVDNPFLKIYIAPLTIELLVIIHDVIEILIGTYRRVTGW